MLAGRQRRARQSRGCPVSWWSVHEYVERLLTDTGSWPMVGTPEWCDLADDDPRKRAAVFDAAQHFALRVETSQAAMAGERIPCSPNSTEIRIDKWAAYPTRPAAKTGMG